MMMTTVTKKSHSKKVKLDHDLVRAMAETPHKIYQEARRKATALRCARNGTPIESYGPLP